METEIIKNEIEIDIRGLFGAILNRLTIIILIGILLAGLSFAYTQFFVDEQYVSQTQVYIRTQTNSEEEDINTSDIAMATYLANDYRLLMESEPVLSEVKKELNLDESTTTLKSMIDVELEEDSRVMVISVTSTNPELAKKIADKVRDVANEKTKDIMGGIEAIVAIDEAKLPTYAKYPNVQKNTMMGFIIGFAISVLIVAISFILDDTIKTPDDVEKRLGVSVLASIPLKSANSGKGYGYGYGYGYGEKNETSTNQDEADSDELEELQVDKEV